MTTEFNADNQFKQCTGMRGIFVNLMRAHPNMPKSETLPLIAEATHYCVNPEHEYDWAVRGGWAPGQGRNEPGCARWRPE